MPKRQLTASEHSALNLLGDAYVADLLASRKRGRDSDVSGESSMLFCFISKGRPANVPSCEARVLAGGAEECELLWIVARGEKAAYEAAGARGQVLEGGGLCASRNLAIETGRSRGFEHVVQLSDDLRRVDVIRAGSSLGDFVETTGWTAPRDLSHANRVVKRLGTENVSPVAAARLVLASMRAVDAKLGGCYPTANMGQAISAPPIQTAHFVVGDLVVIDVASPVRFDERFVLKEDYDFTCQHLFEHGAVARCNRVIAEFVHRTNAGGACDVRNDQLERDMIGLLAHKWPGAFRASTNVKRRTTEVMLRWNERSVHIGGKRNLARPALPECFRRPGEDDDSPRPTECPDEESHPSLRLARRPDEEDGPSPRRPLRRRRRATRDDAGPRSPDDSPSRPGDS